MKKYIIVPVNQYLINDIQEILSAYYLDVLAFLDYFLENYSSWQSDTEQCSSMLYELLVNTHTELCDFQQHEENIYILQNLTQQLFIEVNAFLEHRNLENIECFSLDRMYKGNGLAFYSMETGNTAMQLSDSFSGSIRNFLNEWPQCLVMK